MSFNETQSGEIITAAAREELARLRRENRALHEVLESSSSPVHSQVVRTHGRFAGDFDFKEYWRTIRKHQLVLISLAVAAALLVLAWRFVRTPQYEAVSTILIQPQTPQVLAENESFNNEQFSSNSDYDYYRTQFELLKSASLAARVIRDNGLAANPLFNPADQHPGLIASVIGYARNKLASLAGVKNDDSATVENAGPGFVDPNVIRAYLARLTIQPVHNTRLVVVGFTTPDRNLSVRITNAHVKTFIRQGLELQAQTGRDVEEFLQQKLGELKNQVEQSEAALNAYRRKVGIVTFEEGEQNSTTAQSPLMQRLAELNSQLTEAASKRIALGTQHQMILRSDYDSLPEVISNPVIQNLKEQVAQLSTQYAAMKNRFNPGYHPRDDLRARLIASERALSLESKMVAESVDADYRAAVADESKIAQEIARIKAQTLALNDASLQEAVLERQVEADRELYRNVLQRMNEISVASEVPASNVSVVDVARSPAGATGPRLILLLVFSVAAAGFVGIAMVFFVESLDDALKSTDDISRYLDLPSLGVVPDFVKLNGASGWPNGYLLPRWRRTVPKAEDGQPASRHRELLVSEGVFSAAAEIYRTIRSAVMFSRAGGTPKSILVTSSTTGEGKTITAVNLATAFAHTGGRTLLMDTDFRRSRCHEILSVDAERGLSDVLVRQSTLADAIFDTQVPGLSFIGVGMPPPNPSELLASLEMRTLMRQLSEIFDFIIMDTAPVMPVSDSVGLSTMVEAVLLVAGGDTSRRLVGEACLRLHHVGAPILGVILNRVNAASHAYYSENDYSHYYSSSRNGAAEAGLAG